MTTPTSYDRITIKRETWEHLCSNLTNQQRMKLIDAILTYAFDGCEPDYRLPDGAKTLFPVYKSIVSMGRKKI